METSTSEAAAAAPPSRVSVWIQAARPKTLWAAVAPVALGTAFALEAGRVHWPSALVALLAAVLIQIGTNFANDYSDFVKGADTAARKGPLRITQAGLVAPQAVRLAATLVFAAAFVSGMYLVWRGGWIVLLIGVLSILFGVLYTAGRYALAYLGLGDLFVLIFFGPVAVAGTYYVQVLSVSGAVLIAGLGPGLLAVAILLANNIRDIEEDRAANKRTLVVRLGRSFGIGLYTACLLGAAAVPVGLAVASGSHWWSLVAAPVVLLGAPNIRTFVREREAERLNPLLGSTARLLLVYSLVFSIGWNL